MKQINKEWFIAAAKRAIHTWCQTAAGFFTVGIALTDINWGMLFSVSTAAAIWSFLKSVAVGLPEVPDGPENKSE